MMTPPQLKEARIRSKQKSTPVTQSRSKVYSFMKAHLLREPSGGSRQSQRGCYRVRVSILMMDDILYGNIDQIWNFFQDFCLFRCWISIDRSQRDLGIPRCFSCAHGFINFTLLPSHNLFWLLTHAHNLEIKNIKARPYYSYGAHMVLHV